MGVEKDFPIAILFRAFNDRPPQNIGEYTPTYLNL